MRTEQPTKCLFTSAREGEVARIKLGIRYYPGIRYLLLQGGGSDVVFFCLYWCQSFGDISPYVYSLYF